ncbi:MAG: mechanosensitive ion channel domain-containing protein [Gaiellales bacterium]
MIVTRAIMVAAIILVAVVVKRVIVAIIRRSYWRRVDKKAAQRGMQELMRVKRQKTLVTLIESLVRYVVYGIAVVAILGLLTGGQSRALFGASLVVVLVGFGFQRLLGDVVAGALMLFEGHFAVGDVITVHYQGLTGVVEEFSLRTTSLRTFDGDRITIMNGNLTHFTRWSYGQREFRLELLVRGDEGVEQAQASCASEAGSQTGLWLRPPRVDHIEPISGSRLRRVTISVIVAPDQEVLVDRLVAVLEAMLGDSQTLVGPITPISLYLPTYEKWRAEVLLRD